MPYNSVVKTTPLVIFILFLQSAALADVIKLQNGRQVTGTVLEEDQETISLEVEGGTVQFKTSQVVWVQKGSEKYLRDQKEAARYYKKAKALLDERRFLASAEQFQKALEFESKSPEIWNNLGTAYAQDGQDQKALEAFQAAAKYDPDNLTILENTANAYLSLRRYGEAAALLHSMLSRRTAQKAEIYLKLSLVFYRAGFQKQSLKLFSAAKKQGIAEFVKGSNES